MPVLISGLRTFVAFYLSLRDPIFAGMDPSVRDPRGDHGVGVVEFKDVASVTKQSNAWPAKRSQKPSRKRSCQKS